ncbi:MAG: thioredoxin family protein [Bacteroidales bacterium]|jgi:peroxiredoxin|nr:thioredoxin family protein [Bacteroidales bacterium]
MKKYLFISMAALMITGLLNSQSPYKAGDVASDFKLKNVKGEMVSLADIKDADGFIVAFWCNTCPVVKKYDQRLQALHAKYAPKGYPVIAINPNDPAVSPGDSYEKMKETAEKLNYRFEYLFDETQEVARKYGATNTPHIYILSWRDGKLVVDYVGAIDNNTDDAAAADRKYAEDALESILKGQPVSVAATRAIGCSIKWKKG